MDNPQDEERRLRHIHLMKQVVDNPLFDQMFADIRMDLSNAMFNNTNQTARDALYNESQVLDRVKQRLVRYANEAKGVKRELKED